MVAPGFIDIHAHGQGARNAGLQAQDGVTTALDTALGVFPVADWYQSREGRAPIHFGAAAGHIGARIKLKHGIDVGHRPTDHAHPAAGHDPQKRATARGAFWGMIARIIVVLTVAFSPWTSSIAFLWHNLIGAVVVVVVGMAISYTKKPDKIVATSAQLS